MPIFKINVGKAINILLPGHASELQDSVSVAEPLHAAPPCAAAISSGLVRVLEPPPHVAEQVDHPPYAPHTQSTTYENEG